MKLLFKGWHCIHFKGITEYVIVASLFDAPRTLRVKYATSTSKPTYYKNESTLSKPWPQNLLPETQNETTKADPCIDNIGKFHENLIKSIKT